MVGSPSISQDLPGQRLGWREALPHPGRLELREALVSYSELDGTQKEVQAALVRGDAAAADVTGTMIDVDRNAVLTFVEAEAMGGEPVAGVVGSVPADLSA